MTTASLMLTDFLFIIAYSRSLKKILLQENICQYFKPLSLSLEEEKL